MISDYQSTLQTDDDAPDFLLFDQTGREPRHALSQYGGWRLVWWLPSTIAVHSSGCGDHIGRDFSSHNDERLQILGLSFDTPEQSADFVRRANISFPMLSADVETGRAYGVYRGDEDEWNCFPRKRAFLVAPDGRIAKVYLNIDPDFFVHEVLADLDDLAPVRAGVWQRITATLRG